MVAPESISLRIAPQITDDPAAGPCAPSRRDSTSDPHRDGPKLTRRSRCITPAPFTGSHSLSHYASLPAITDWRDRPNCQRSSAHDPASLLASTVDAVGRSDHPVSRGPIAPAVHCIDIQSSRLIRTTRSSCDRNNLNRGDFEGQVPSSKFLGRLLVSLVRCHFQAGHRFNRRSSRRVTGAILPEISPRSTPWSRKLK